MKWKIISDIDRGPLPIFDTDGTMKTIDGCHMGELQGLMADSGCHAELHSDQVVLLTGDGLYVVSADERSVSLDLPMWPGVIRKNDEEDAPTLVLQLLDATDSVTDHDNYVKTAWDEVMHLCRHGESGVVHLTI